LNELRSPFRTAEAFGIEEIIDPRDTRPLLCEWVETAYDLLPTQLGPKRRGCRPWVEIDMRASRVRGVCRAPTVS